MIISSLGNIELLKLHKNAFLWSREIRASVVLKCYDWAIGQREKGNCVISGFHSKIEKDFFHYLISGTQPVILALARGIKIRIEPKIKKEIDSQRLLIVSPFEKEVTRVMVETAEKRNLFIIELADEIAVGFISKGGMIDRLVNQVSEKKIFYI
jgi:hypothetical protein